MHIVALHALTSHLYTVHTLRRQNTKASTTYGNTNKELSLKRQLINLLGHLG